MSGLPVAALRRTGAAVTGTARAVERCFDRAPRWLGPSAFLFVTVLGIAVAIYGAFFADPDIHVGRFDAGPVSQFAIRHVTTYPELDLYIVGLDDGRLRALDGRVQDSDCAVDWLPDDPRGSVRNPGQINGAFVDPCGGAVWSMLGDAVSGTSRPLRTPQMTYRTGEGDVPHAFVEMINHPAFP
jgi:hypothetical protein